MRTISTRHRANGSTLALVQDDTGRLGLERSGQPGVLWGDPISLLAHTLLRAIRRADTGERMFPAVSP